MMCLGYASDIVILKDHYFPLWQRADYGGSLYFLLRILLKCHLIRLAFERDEIILIGPEVCCGSIEKDPLGWL
jgi:hypothetical protein